MGNKVNLLSSQLKNFFKFRACAISARKAKHLDVTTMLTNSQAHTPLGQLERAYYFSYLINSFGRFSALFDNTVDGRPGNLLYCKGGIDCFRINVSDQDELISA